MANKSLINPQNKSGNFFVDTRCIGCNACNRVAPDIFSMSSNLSYVKNQPQNEKENHDCVIALLSCPVSSIGMNDNKDLIDKVAKTLPLCIEENIYFCGFNSHKSYGANSYFIKRDDGNILIDSPRFDSRLVRSFENMGGIKYIYLTHKDDIADYKKFKDHFNSQVIYHKDDFNDKIKQADITLEGDSVYTLDDEVKIIPQSGHTKGHTVLLYKDFYLFSGDHLAYDSCNNSLYSFKDYCWFDWDEQLRSLKRLRNYKFSYVLPGHRKSFKSDEVSMHKMLNDFIVSQD